MSLTKATYSMIDGAPISVLDFGAIGDGVADDTAAFQAAINAAKISGQAVYIPPANYVIDTITIPSRLTLFSDAPGTTVLTHKATSANPLITIEAGPVIFCDIGGFAIAGNGVAGEIGIYLNAAPQVGSPFDGGMWYAHFYDLDIYDVAHKGIWVRGGNTRNANPYNYLTPNQFLHFERVRVYRPATATSRCLSLTGQVGQVSMDGECLFDSNYQSTVGRQGCNICVSREFKNSVTNAVGDLFDASVENGSSYPADYSTDTFALAANWAAVDGISPARVTIKATTQNSRYGVIVDNSTNVSVQDCWFENTDRAVTVVNQGYATLQSNRFANAGGSSANGYVVKSENSTMAWYGNYVVGSFDVLTVQYQGSLVDGGGNYSTSATEGEGIGAFRQIAVTGTTLAVTRYDRVFVVTSGTIGSPTPVNTITSNLPVGARLTVYVAGGYVELTGGGNISFGGSPVFTTGDCFEFMHASAPIGEWVLVARSQP